MYQHETFVLSTSGNHAALLSVSRRPHRVIITRWNSVDDAEKIIITAWDYLHPALGEIYPKVLEGILKLEASQQDDDGPPGLADDDDDAELAAEPARRGGRGRGRGRSPRLGGGLWRLRGGRGGGSGSTSVIRTHNRPRVVPSLPHLLWQGNPVRFRAGPAPHSHPGLGSG